MRSSLNGVLTFRNRLLKNHGNVTILACITCTSNYHKININRRSDFFILFVTDIRIDPNLDKLQFNKHVFTAKPNFKAKLFGARDEANSFLKRK